MRIYYAHPISTYNTSIERDDIAILESIGFDVLNPNHKSHELGYRLSGMDYFLGLIERCDFLAFRAFDDGMIPAGVFKEIEYAKHRSFPVMEISGKLENRELSIDDTRTRLKQLGRGNG